MPIKALPRRPSLEQYRKQAKDLIKSWHAGVSEAIERTRQFHPRFQTLCVEDARRAAFALSDAQWVVAREHGSASWPEFRERIEALRRERFADPADAFVEAASVPLEGLHIAGSLDEAEAILLKHPEVAERNIFVAAILGDDARVRRFLEIDPRNATAKGGLHDWDPLTYLCFSRYLRLDRERSAAFMRAAKALLDAGASPAAGWLEEDRGDGQRMWESVVYGAAGLAQDLGLTRLLIERGADPNDGETPYHVPESYDNAVMEFLVESGKLTEESMRTMLVRKADWHDRDGVHYLLEHGANPNLMTRWKFTALQHALRRDNHLAILEDFLDHGADPLLENGQDRRSGVAMASHRGRGDVLGAMERRGFAMELHAVDRLIAACAMGDAERVEAIAQEDSALVREVVAQGGRLLAEFAGNGNTEGVRLLLGLGVSAGALYRQGDGYFEIARDSTALHVAAWRARHATVRLLIGRGAAVNAVDAHGQTPLMLAVRACTDSHWKDGRTPESIEALLRAGASTRGIKTPTGYAEADALLLAYRTVAGT